jgi:DNA-binding GntR family transcriptional regulator
VVDAPDSSPTKPAERVASSLRDAIRSGVLLPGEHIRQGMWADRLAVSRLPVREALSTLAADGTVEHDPNRGYFVTKRPASAVAQLYLLRELIEPEVIRTIQWPDAETLARLERARDEAVEALDARDARTAMERDREFCWMIWDLSPLNIVVAEAKRLWHQCDPHRASAFTSPAFVDALAHDYRARFDTYLHHLRKRERDHLVNYVIRERRVMVEFLNTGNAAVIAPDNKTAVSPGGRQTPRVEPSVDS